TTLSPTREGAIHPVVRFLLRGAMEECLVAGLTYPAFGSEPPPVSHDEQLLVPDSPVGTHEVAAMARRDKVFGGVVGGVAVEVVNRQCSRLGAMSRHPVDFCSAVMTGMRPRADLLVEDDSVDRDLSRRRTQRMSSTSGVLVSTHDAREGTH